MDRLVKIAFGAIFIIALITAAAAIIELQKQSSDTSTESTLKSETYPVKQEFRLRFTLKNASSSHFDNAALSFLLPPENLGNQRSRFEVIGATFRNTENSHKNIVVSDLPPFGQASFDLFWYVEKPTSPLRIKAEANHQDYLLSSRLIQSEHPEIRTLAKKLQSEKASQKDTAKNIFDWVNSNLTYSGYLKQDQGALFALRKRKGDCTEFSYLTAALLRANQIPARVMVGFTTPSNGLLTASDLHNWVEVFVDDSWQILDAQKRQAFVAPSLYTALAIVEEEKGSLGVIDNDLTSVSVTF